jgi:hypothetical protein
MNRCQHCCLACDRALRQCHCSLMLAAVIVSVATLCCLRRRGSCSLQCLSHNRRKLGLYFYSGVFGNEERSKCPCSRGCHVAPLRLSAESPRHFRAFWDGRLLILVQFDHPSLIAVRGSRCRCCRGVPVLDADGHGEDQIRPLSDVSIGLFCDPLLPF